MEMILWMYKLISTARRAFAGRKHPHQMAWAVAFGLLLGVIPHGNLLAVLVLLVVLSLKINHAMAGLTAVGSTFLASHLDPYSDQIGQYVLTQPDFRETALAAWQLPLVPWTDLNNTIVMGSFVIGVASLLPVFVLTYPLFRMLAPKTTVEPEPTKTHSAAVAEDTSTPENGGSAAKAHQLVLVDQGHTTVVPPHRPKNPRRADQPQQVTSQPKSDAVAVDSVKRLNPPEQSMEKHVAVQTRIDVIRMKDHRSVAPVKDAEPGDAQDRQPMDEALNYLLRQLRDSQRGKAA